MNDQKRRDEEARMQAERIAVVDASRVLVENSRLLRGEAARLMEELDQEGHRAGPVSSETTHDTGPPRPPVTETDPIDSARRELHAAVDAVADGAAKIKKHLGGTG